MLYPLQRGATNPTKTPYQTRHLSNVPDSVPVDFWMHFPAGDKSDKDIGSGHTYQIRRANINGHWDLYDPFNPSFKFRTGLCGDVLHGKKSRDHLKGGLYYDGGRISAEYISGGVIDIEFGYTAHHNGFMELYLCQVEKCPGGDISHDCFLQGHCHRLERAGNDNCETGYDHKCGPTDKKYPSRWYLPCKSVAKQRAANRKDRGKYWTYGPGTIRYKLPKGVSCEHCVLQWYWTAANGCNPEGVIEYFTGPHGPRNWPNCEGEANAVGGYTTTQPSCGSREKGELKVPEEYYQCSDIRIVKPRTPSTTSPLTTTSTTFTTTTIQQHQTQLISTTSTLLPLPTTAGNGHPHSTTGNGQTETPSTPPRTDFLHQSSGAIQHVKLTSNNPILVPGEVTLTKKTVIRYTKGVNYWLQAVTEHGVDWVTFEVRDIGGRRGRKYVNLEVGRNKGLRVFLSVGGSGPKAIATDIFVVVKVTASNKWRKDSDFYQLRFSTKMDEEVTPFVVV